MCESNGKDYVFAVSFLPLFSLLPKSMTKPILVVKFGTASLTKPSGEPDDAIIAQIAQEIAVLASTHHLVIVSSGAVGAGKQFIRGYQGEISQRKAAAAIGNPILLGMYARHLAPFGLSVAQSLCERQHFAKRDQFLQLKETYQTLWENGIIPIANENDVVSNRELKFSDNDELATLIAVGFGASALFICTQSGGLLDANKRIIPRVPRITEEVMQWVAPTKSSLGTGGMASKLTFTKLATELGIKTIIFGMKHGLQAAFEEKAGTVFPAQEASLPARLKWLASGSLTQGALRIDPGAAAAIGKRSSLLAVGIVEVIGDFATGEIVEIQHASGEPLAVARVRASSDVLRNKTLNQIAAHADDIVLR